MASGEFVLAINPDPTKQSARIEKTKYDIVREAILENLFDRGPMTFTQLGELIEDQLQNDFGSSVKWYYTIVRQDMEVGGGPRRAPPGRGGGGPSI